MITARDLSIIDYFLMETQRIIRPEGQKQLIIQMKNKVNRELNKIKIKLEKKT